MKNAFMPWVDFLPELGDPIRSERNRLADMQDRADALEKQAAALRADLKSGRASLLAKIAVGWHSREIASATRAAGDHLRPTSLNFITDHALRAMIITLDGGSTALDVLNVFRLGQVIRQHNLLSTATDTERRATLNRVLDWWNHAAVPLLDRMDS